MYENCRCPLCGSEAKKELSLRCTIFSCSKCHEFEINTFENVPPLTTENKQLLSAYFSHADNFAPLRKTIITKNNYKEILALCKEFLEKM